MHRKVYTLLVIMFLGLSVLGACFAQAYYQVECGSVVSGPGGGIYACVYTIP